MQKYTNEQIIESARKYKTRHEWEEAESALYSAAYRRNLLPLIYEFLPPKISAPTYTDEELLTHAKQFPNWKSWYEAGKEEIKNGIPSHCGVVMKRGKQDKEFYQQCTAHMVHLPSVPKGTCHTHTHEEVVMSAQKYKSKSEWKKAELKLYRTSLRRGDDYHTQMTAHMLPVSNPYSGAYIVYAYEFTDHSVYVGLTCKPAKRKEQHLIKGPVFHHMAICPTNEYKVLQENISTPHEASEREQEWMKKYEAEGWEMLNTSKGGSLGTVTTTWNREKVLLKAKEYATKQAWIDGSRISYNLAKRMGWFEEATGHMPERDSVHLLGRVLSEETKQKISEAHQGKILSETHKARIGMGVLSRLESNPEIRVKISHGNIGKGRGKGWMLSADERLFLSEKRGEMVLNKVLLTEEEKKTIRNYRYKRDAVPVRVFGWQLSPDEMQVVANLRGSAVENPVVLSANEKKAVRRFRYHAGNLPQVV